MGSVNVNRNVTDQFYRYKMPRLLAKVEGKGNGIKTVIANMVDIAKALNRPPTYPTKYFGCELGAQTQFDFKNDRFIVNGAHDSSKLQTLLDGFIKKFVLCHECDNPETNLLVLPKKQTITQQCIACGHITNVDMRHKLTTFILKNPPEHNPSAIGASLTTPKEKKKDKKKTGKSKKNGDGEHNSSSHADKEDSDYDVTAPGMNGGSDDDWTADTSEAAVAKRMLDLTDGARGLTLNDDLEKTQQERLEIFYNYVESKRNGKIEGLDKEIVGEAERLDVKDKAPLILVELLFDGNIINQIKIYRILFLRITNGNVKAQKYLLGGLEQLVKLYHETLLPKVPHILKALYDADIIEEEVMIEWASKASKKYVSREFAQEIRDKAAPFIKWLKEAEEEESDSEEEEDDDDDVEVVYADRILPADRQVPQKSAPIIQEDDNDIDIDAI